MWDFQRQDWESPGETGTAHGDKRWKKGASVLAGQSRGPADASGKRQRGDSPHEHGACQDRLHLRNEVLRLISSPSTQSGVLKQYTHVESSRSTLSCEASTI